MMSEKIKILLVKNKMNVSDLARSLNSSPQNLYHKLKRDNFSENELHEIAQVLNARVDIKFIMNNGDEI